MSTAEAIHATSLKAEALELAADRVCKLAAMRELEDGYAMFDAIDLHPYGWLSAEDWHCDGSLDRLAVRVPFSYADDAYRLAVSRLHVKHALELHALQLEEMKFWAEDRDEEWDKEGLLAAAHLADASATRLLQAHSVLTDQRRIKGRLDVRAPSWPAGQVMRAARRQRSSVSVP